MPISQDLVKNCTDGLIGATQMLIRKAKSIDLLIPSVGRPHINPAVPAQDWYSGKPEAESAIKSVVGRLCNFLWDVDILLLNVHTGMAPHLVVGRIDTGVYVVFKKFEVDSVEVLGLGEAS